jgi:hypothetical protein
MLSRRGLLAGLLATPLVVRAESIMRVKSVSSTYDMDAYYAWLKKITDQIVSQAAIDWVKANEATMMYGDITTYGEFDKSGWPTEFPNRMTYHYESILDFDVDHVIRAHVASAAEVPVSKLFVMPPRRILS